MPLRAPSSSRAANAPDAPIRWTAVEPAKSVAPRLAIVVVFDQMRGDYLSRWQDLFGAQFDVLLYDLTSTYVEGEAELNPKAKRGYSRDGRPDCKQVVVALVITPAAAAQRLTGRPTLALLLSIAIALVSTEGGILLSLAKAWPPSFFITTISFSTYVAARLVDWSRSRQSRLISSPARRMWAVR